MTKQQPMKMPHRRPRLSLIGPVKGNAARLPMLKMAKTRPEPELAVLLHSSSQQMTFTRHSSDVDHSQTKELLVLRLLALKNQSWCSDRQ
jgi:hypothetical protein